MPRVTQPRNAKIIVNAAVFIQRTHAELALLEKELGPEGYSDLVAYFAGFFFSEDERLHSPDPHKNSRP
jgi:hypothetical protein